MVNYYKKRWYDSEPWTGEVLDVLQTLTIRSHYEIAREVIKVIDVIRANNRERDEVPLSLGLNK